MAHVIMPGMNNNPVQKSLNEIDETDGEKQEEKSSLITTWMEKIARLGLGEAAIKIGTNALTILAVFMVVWLMQTLYRPSSLIRVANVQAADLPDTTPTPVLDTIQLPELVSLGLDGVARQAQAHTTIPSRPRVDVIKYTVQIGNSIFSIADKFGLQPTTILFGNYETLKDSSRLPQAGAATQYPAGGRDLLPVAGNGIHDESVAGLWG